MFKQSLLFGPVVHFFFFFYDFFGLETQTVDCWGSRQTWFLPRRLPTHSFLSGLTRHLEGVFISNYVVKFFFKQSSKVIKPVTPSCLPSSHLASSPSSICGNPRHVGFSTRL